MDTNRHEWEKVGGEEEEPRKARSTRNGRGRRGRGKREKEMGKERNDERHEVQERGVMV